MNRGMKGFPSPPIFTAIAWQTVVQSITTTFAVVNYDKIVSDPLNCIRVGPDWSFYTPFQGAYQFNFAAARQGGAETFATLYMNGVQYSANLVWEGKATTSWNSLVAPIALTLPAGVKIQFLFRAASGTINTEVTWTHMSVLGIKESDDS